MINSDGAEEHTFSNYIECNMVLYNTTLAVNEYRIDGDLTFSGIKAVAK